MTDKNPEKSGSSEERVDLSSLLGGGLTPEWARKDPGQQKFDEKKFSDSGWRRDSGRDGYRRGGGNRRDDRNRSSMRRRDSNTRDRQRGRDSVSEPRGRGKPESHAPAPNPRVADAGSGFQGGPRGQRQEQRGPRPRRDFGRQQRPQLPVTVRFLPDQKRLTAVIHKIHASRKAWSLRDVANLFLDHKGSVLVKFESQPGDVRQDLFQCKLCGMVGLVSDDLIAHFRDAHLTDFYDVTCKTVDPPTGNFVCVYRCGLSGVLLGPPNHHSTHDKIEQVRRERYPKMTSEAYQSHIERLHDAERVEQWREQSTEIEVYTPKSEMKPAPEKPAAEVNEGEGGAEGTGETPEVTELTRAAAEADMLRDVAPKQVVRAHKAVCKLSIAERILNRELLYCFRDAWRRENRFPASLFFALRGAFRHRRLFVFKAGEGRGMDFAVGQKPTPIDPTHVVDELRNVLTYVEDHPACTAAELFDGLGIPPDPRSDEAVHFLSHLQWLVEKGHIIEYYNGVLVLPGSRPAFRHLTDEEQQASEAAKAAERAERKKHAEAEKTAQVAQSEADTKTGTAAAEQTETPEPKQAEREPNAAATTVEEAAAEPENADPEMTADPAEQAAGPEETAAQTEKKAKADTAEPDAEPEATTSATEDAETPDIGDEARKA